MDVINACSILFMYISWCVLNVQGLYKLGNDSTRELEGDDIVSEGGDFLDWLAIYVYGYQILYESTHVKLYIF